MYSPKAVFGLTRKYAHAVTKSVIGFQLVAESRSGELIGRARDLRLAAEAMRSI